MNFLHRLSQRARIVCAASVVGVVVVEGTVLAQQHHNHVSHDSFLHYQVGSTDALVKALNANPALRKSYARHFNLPESQVIDFVKRTLVPYHLPTGRRVTNYGITKNGTIYPVSTYLPKGTLVWATRSGLPILKWDCANPLTSHLPVFLTRPRVSSVKKTKKPTRIASDTADEMPSPSDKKLANVESPEMTPPEAVDTSAINIAPNLTGLGATVVPAVNAVPVPAIGAGGSGGLLPLIPLLAGVATIGHGGGSGTHDIPTVAVPEPGSAGLALLAGLPLLAIRGRRKGK